MLTFLQRDDLKILFKENGLLDFDCSYNAVIAIKASMLSLLLWHTHLLGIRVTPTSISGLVSMSITNSETHCDLVLSHSGVQSLLVGSYSYGCTHKGRGAQVKNHGQESWNP